MHCGDDFAMYTCVELLCCTPESNIMLCQFSLYIYIKLALSIG